MPRSTVGLGAPQRRHKLASPRRTGSPISMEQIFVVAPMSVSISTDQCLIGSCLYKSRQSNLLMT
jgi:hypothetical protein